MTLLPRRLLRAGYTVLHLPDAFRSAWPDWEGRKQLPDMKEASGHLGPPSRSARVHADCTEGPSLKGPVAAAPCLVRSRQRSDGRRLTMVLRCCL